MKLYMVVAESYLRDDYGSFPKCLGIFDTKEKAEEMREGYESLLRTCESMVDYAYDKEEYIKELMEYYFKIKEVELNEKYPLNFDARSWYEVVGGINLGGYAE